MTEDRKTREKRLSIRSWRRGTREMDMLLGPFSDARLATLDDATLDLYEVMLSENDQDLYQWVSGQAPAPDTFSNLLDQVRAFAEDTHTIRKS
ncbi:succinate dehydrogenase assembly factor 2 [Alphaproteobacteria bacterium GH1-50]|uniref:FAD assembly factor SdhE n=1 Tax=Kangsaoukella pontilimi TaxID=2691042 RepID=A0A7C9IH44_9RHOB|nr:succinate dehydrogenase assembly factor 2 [Kangsaoukella pontilimi]MXQ08784.1 succinate dehydrogenase assembly factor 2 [Kangsaoukella pontilimi]